MCDNRVHEWPLLAFRSVIASTVEVSENLSAYRFFEFLKKVAMPMPPPIGSSADRRNLRFYSKAKIQRSALLSDALHRRDLVAAAI